MPSLSPSCALFAMSVSSVMPVFAPPSLTRMSRFKRVMP